jgi:hypothetical protein
MRYVMLALCLVVAISCHALSLRPDAPVRYVVQPGDTLWGIANRYLKNPWEWKELWHANPQIQNPNHLYAGAVIALRYHNEKPYLRVLSNGTIKLSPHMKALPLEDPIPPIPYEELKAFLNGSLILDRNVLKDAPFVVAFPMEHAMAGQGDEVFVEHLCPFKRPPGGTISYAIYRRCGVYYEPGTGQFLGYKASLIGYAELLHEGEPATVVVTDITQGVRLRDRVLPNTFPAFDLYFEPKTPRVPVFGKIIDFSGDYTQGGLGLIAVISRGRDAGLQAGDVLGVYSKPRQVSNKLFRYRRWGKKCDQQCVTIPPERIGEMMVFRVFSRASYALVVRSTRPIKKYDTVTNP